MLILYIADCKFKCVTQLYWHFMKCTNETIERDMIDVNKKLLFFMSCKAQYVAQKLRKAASFKRRSWIWDIMLKKKNNLEWSNIHTIMSKWPSFTIAFLTTYMLNKPIVSGKNSLIEFFYIQCNSQFCNLWKK